MIITMHCGGMPFNGDSLKTKSLGGSESAAYYVARELARRGHRVSLFTNEQKEGVWDGVKYIWAGDMSEQSPLGERFHFYAANTPCDVLIVQRLPGAFIHQFQAKLNIAWLHDLALIRQRGQVAPALWNIDAVFCVSEWHKKQLAEVYGIPESVIMPVKNGIDLAMFDRAKPLVKLIDQTKYSMIYSSRPERGLEHLVRPGGIMERLLEVNPSAHLYVCNYDNNPPHLAGYYQALYERIEELPNCTALGHLTKGDLAGTMAACNLHIYPTEFEEVSCITAMEDMAAGLPMLTSGVGALQETCEGAGVMMIPLKDGAVDEDGFVAAVKFLSESQDERIKMSEMQREAAKSKTWASAVDMFEANINELFNARTSNIETVLKHLIHVSDYYAAEKLRSQKPTDLRGMETAESEMDVCYRFARENTWKEHYESYYEYEKNRGINYGPEDVSDNQRYRTVAGLISSLPAGSIVYDYGCAHGHYTINLAKQFPDLNFIGIDLAASNIDIARKWADDDGIKNAAFFNGWADIEHGALRDKDSAPLAIDAADAIIAAEVLEHVADPQGVTDVLCKYLKPTGQFIGTTPVGPWEAQGYLQHWPWRAHVHHFEREDIHDMYSMHPDLDVKMVVTGPDQNGDVLGSYVFSFGKPKHASGAINYDRKLRQQAPRQTVAACLIVKDGEDTLARCLKSIRDHVDEIIIGVDKTTTDETRAIAARYVKGFSPRADLLFDIDSPMDTGFDEARNRVISKAQADWIIWLDADEVLFHGGNLRKYLRQNAFDAYAVRQLHYSVEPPGVMKVDLPSRIFRNRKGIKFFGVVHEHPEVEINEGIGPVMVISDLDIAHYGYSTELVRRRRFERNIGLLIKDREKYPDRHLGKFLWLRDLAQMCRWEAERNGGAVSAAMQERARMGVKIWEELLDSDQLRMIADPENIEFYSTCVQVLNEGFDLGIMLDTSKLNGGAHPEKQKPIKARFFSMDHAHRLLTKLLNERTKEYDSKYY